MRNFQLLDAHKIDPEAETLELFYQAGGDDKPRLALRREGGYVTISASYGALELALRPRYDDVIRTLSRLSVVHGLHTTRQVGTGQAYMALGLTAEDGLLLRATIVADATGHFSINMELTSAMRKILFDWLEVS